MDDRLLVDAGVLVRALELRELVDVRADFARHLAFMSGAFDAHDDAFGVDRIDHAGAFAQHHRAGIAGRDVFHAGADIRRVGAQQRNRLALHVRSHERAVGVVVLEERNQAGRNRDQLLRTDVDVLDLIAMLQHEVAGLAGVGTVRGRCGPCRRSPRWPGRWCTCLLPTPRDIRSGLRIRPVCFLPSRSRVGLLDIGAAHDVADLVTGVAGIQDPDFVDHRALITLRYGLSMKPYSLMRAKQESDEIRPMFGPSGVSMGQMRP